MQQKCAVRKQWQARNGSRDCGRQTGLKDCKYEMSKATGNAKHFYSQSIHRARALRSLGEPLLQRLLDVRRFFNDDLLTL